MAGDISYMQTAGRGKIINTASMASLLVPHPQKQIAYNASKSAVVKMTQTLGETDGKAKASGGIVQELIRSVGVLPSVSCFAGHCMRS